jgi:hypothetical protein
MSNHNRNEDDNHDDATAAAALQHRPCGEEDNNAEHDPKSVVHRRRRTGLLICAVLYTVLYVGAFFAQGPMQLLVCSMYSYDTVSYLVLCGVIWMLLQPTTDLFLLQL